MASTSRYCGGPPERASKLSGGVARSSGMNTMAVSRNSPRSWLTLAVFLAVVIGVGSLIGILTAPGEWYAGLDKPPFNPPNWIFGPVWFVLYVLIAIAGWRTFMRNPGGLAMKLWGGQMV